MGGARKERGGLDREDPSPGRGALRAHTHAIGLGQLRWWPALASVPQNLPLSSCNPKTVELGCTWCVGGSGPFFLPVRPLVPYAEGWGKVEAELGSQGNKTDWAGQETVSTQCREWKKLENQPTLFSALLGKRWAGCLGQQGQSREGVSGKFGFSSEALQPEIHPASLTSCPDPPRPGKLLALGGPRSPRAYSWALTGGF